MLSSAFFSYLAAPTAKPWGTEWSPLEPSRCESPTWPILSSHPPNQTLLKNVCFPSISQKFQWLNLINANKYHQASIRCKPRVCIYEGKDSLRSNPCLEEVKIHYGGQLKDANNSNCRVYRTGSSVFLFIWHNGIAWFSDQEPGSLRLPLTGNFVSSSNRKWRQVAFRFSRLPAGSEILWFHISLLLLHLEF